MENKDLCEVCRMAVTAGTAEHDPVLAAHLAECPDCRAFAEFSKVLMHCSPAVPEDIPELAAIRARAAGGGARLRVAAFRVLGMAAALALAAAAVFYPRMTGPAKTVASGYGQAVAVSAAAEGGTESAWYENMAETPQLAWDSRSALEADFANTMANLRQGGGWNIELFNPIVEEM